MQRAFPVMEVSFHVHTRVKPKLPLGLTSYRCAPPRDYMWGVPEQSDIHTAAHDSGKGCVIVHVKSEDSLRSFSLKVRLLLMLGLQDGRRGEGGEREKIKY